MATPRPPAIEMPIIETALIAAQENSWMALLSLKLVMAITVLSSTFGGTVVVVTAAVSFLIIGLTREGQKRLLKMKQSREAAVS